MGCRGEDRLATGSAVVAVSVSRSIADVRLIDELRRQGKHDEAAALERSLSRRTLEFIQGLPIGRSGWDDPPEGPYGPDDRIVDGTALLGSIRVDWADFWATDHTAADWLIEPIVPAARNVSLTAGAKAGKSLAVLAGVAPAVVGRRSLGRPAGEPLRCLYLDFEMVAADLQERLSDMGFDDGYQPEALAYCLHPPLPPLDTRAGGDRIVAMAKAHRADLVVIDTVSRALEGEENSSDTIRAFYRHTLAPLKAVGAATLRLDHTGHGDTGRARGSSGKLDDVDVAWLLERRDEGFRLKATHRRVGWVPETVDLHLGRDPIEVRLVSGSWPAGTKDAAELLDRLQVPEDASQRTARAALKDAGESLQNSVLRAALKWRREQLEVPA